MKLALMQYQISWENKIDNYDLLSHTLDALQSEQIDLICLPEMSFTGFSMNTPVTKESNNETIMKLQSLSLTYSTAIAAGWVKDCNPLCENHYSIIANGKTIFDVAKHHPFSYSGEDQFFQRGTGHPHTTYKDFNIGACICYDLRFPIQFLETSKHSDLILVPMNWPSSRRHHYLTLLKARAIENQCYIAGINCCGTMNELNYSGDSCLINPNGEVLSFKKQCSIPNSSTTTIFIYEIENDVDYYRKSFPIRNDDLFSN